MILGHNNAQRTSRVATGAARRGVGAHRRRRPHLRQRQARLTATSSPSPEQSKDGVRTPPPPEQTARISVSDKHDWQPRRRRRRRPPPEQPAPLKTNETSAAAAAEPSCASLRPAVLAFLWVRIARALAGHSDIGSLAGHGAVHGHKKSFGLRLRPPALSFPFPRSPVRGGLERKRWLRSHWSGQRLSCVAERDACTPHTPVCPLHSPGPPRLPGP